MKMFILISIFMVELLKYWLGLQICFHTKVNKVWTAFIGFVIYMILINIGRMDDNEIRLVMFSIVIIVVFISVKVNVGERILQILMLVFVITCLDELVGIPLEYFLKYYKGNIQLSDLEYIGSSIISLFLIIILAAAKKRKDILNNYKFVKFIRERISIIVLIMAISLLLTIAELNYARTYIMNERFEIITTIISIISFFSVGLLGLFIIYIKNTNVKMEQLLESERKLKDMHIKYYEALLEKEEDTRKYRHDLNNHLICLNELAKNQKEDLVIDYIERMQGQMKYIQNKCYIVGNDVLDAVLNYYLPTLNEDVKISVIGRCNGKLELNNVDLCTIFSNLLQNAVEEIMRESKNEKKLQIMIQQGKDYLKIVIVNSVSSMHEEINENYLKTQKADKRNHGFGLQNVKYIVKRNGENIEIRKEDNEFTVNIILKNKK